MYLKFIISPLKSIISISQVLGSFLFFLFLSKFSSILINTEARSGALRLNATLDKLKFSKNGWDVPTVRTVGLSGEGFKTLINQISKHSSFLSDNNIFEKINYQKYLKQVKDIASEKILDDFFNPKRMSIIDSEISKPLKDRLSPQDLFEKIK